MMRLPIENLDSIDVVGVRVDGGLDLGISCVGDLDASPVTLDLLRKKVRNYLNEILLAVNPTIKERYGCQANSQVRILIWFPHFVSPEAQEQIYELQHEAEESGVKLLLERRPESMESESDQWGQDRWGQSH